jgi:alpha-galactosidase
MKANRAKCIGPVGGVVAANTLLEVQDCNGSNSQAWITGETTAGSGIFMMKNVANANLCLDVQNASSANNARMDIQTCTGNNNQLFAAQVAP